MPTIAIFFFSVRCVFFAILCLQHCLLVLVLIVPTLLAWLVVLSFLLVPVLVVLAGPAFSPRVLVASVAVAPPPPPPPPPHPCHTWEGGGGGGADREKKNCPSDPSWGGRLSCDPCAPWPSWQSLLRRGIFEVFLLLHNGHQCLIDVFCHLLSLEV